jgi:hypothetical protein
LKSAVPAEDIVLDDLIYDKWFGNKLKNVLDDTYQPRQGSDNGVADKSSIASAGLAGD